MKCQPRPEGTSGKRSLHHLASTLKGHRAEVHFRMSTVLQDKTMRNELLRKHDP
jgi:hypothetical protein